MKKNFLKLLAFVLIGTVTFNSCSDDASVSNETEIPIVKPLSFNIAVASDTHYFDSSLLINDGKAFQEFLNTDRKLLSESGAILDNLFEQIIKKQPELLIIPGDLTKDGEEISHIHFAQKLKKVEDSGIKVLVIPGNHDINNPHAWEFDGEDTRPVKMVNPDQFKAIYKQFGYDEADQIEKGPKLSYVSEPLDGLWVIAIDASIYKNNIQENYPRTGGELDGEHVAWVTSKIKEGRAQGKEVIAMMHHGLVEHFPKQSEIAGDYIIPNFISIAEEFANAGLQFIFTGHSHAQDISQLTVGDRAIYDIQTGSSITYPCPYRIVNITEDKFKVSSHDILMNNELTGNEDLRKFAYNDIYASIMDIVQIALESSAQAGGELAEMIAPIAGILQEIDPSIIQPFATEIYTNMSGGDEAGVKSEFTHPETQEKIRTYDYAKLLLTERGYESIIPLVDAITTDQLPADNEFEVALIK